MAYRRAYNFTGEPSANEDAADWLAALETNIYSSMTNREKVDLFYSKLFKGSPAKKWFNKLPNEGHRRWHVVKQEFESRWCTTTSPSLIAHISADVPVSITIPTTPNISPPPSTTTSELESFHTFIRLADFETINLFLTTATSSSGSENLRALWDRAFKEGYERCREELKVQHEETIQQTLADISEQQQEWHDEQFVEAFTLGRTTGIQNECEYRDSVQASKVNIGIQITPTTATSFIQTIIPFIPPPSTATISTQTEPQISTVSKSIPFPIPIPEPLIPATISSTPFDWANDAATLPIIPTIPPKMPRDLSGLRSSSKNPFSSLRRRHHHSKNQKNLSSCRYTQFQPAHPLPCHTPPLLNNSLDWHRDPSLFELSRVLRTLGWSHP